MRPRHSYAARVAVNRLLDAAMMSPAECVAASASPFDPFGFYTPCEGSPGGSHEAIDTPAGPTCVHCWRTFG